MALVARYINQPRQRTTAEEAVTHVEQRATDIATSITKLEGRLDPLKELLNAMHRAQRGERKVGGDGRDN